MNLNFFGAGMGVGRDKGRSDEGFTLVEMSIVLVIIGLIVGGILKGQEVVNDGKVKIQVAQIDASKSAVNTFYDKFNYYPGDLSAQGVLTASTVSTWNGNQDGVVDSSTAADSGATESAAAGVEMTYAWEQLQLANLLAGAGNATPWAYAGKVSNSFLWYGDFIYGTNIGKMIRLQANGTTAAPKPALRTTDALSIDTKYDDGNPSTGNIYAGTASDATNCCASTACLVTSSGTAKYGLASGSQSAQYCVLFWSLQ